MTVRWDQLTFLTAAQQAKAAEFAAIGEATTSFNQGRGEKSNLDKVTPSEVKAIDALLRTLMDLIGPAQAGIKYARAEFEAAALKAFQDANP